LGVFLVFLHFSDGTLASADCKRSEQRRKNRLLAGEHHRTIISYGCFDCAAAGEPVEGYVPLLVVGYGPPSRAALLL
jgi:hypothetical protein